MLINNSKTVNIRKIINSALMNKKFLNELDVILNELGKIIGICLVMDFCYFTLVFKNK